MKYNKELITLMQEALESAEVCVDNDGICIESAAGDTVPFNDDFDIHLLLKDFTWHVERKLYFHVRGKLTRAQKRDLIEAGERQFNSQSTHAYLREDITPRIYQALHDLGLATREPEMVGAHKSLTAFGTHVAKELAREQTGSARPTTY